MAKKNTKKPSKQTKDSSEKALLSEQQVTTLSRVLMATILLTGFWLFIRPSDVALFLLGFASVCMALLAIIFRKTIMSEYTKSHSESKTENALTKPSKFAYTVNTYVLWPAVLLAGFYAMYIAVF